ncbi:MAG: chorismate mutase [archaeon]
MEEINKLRQKINEIDSRIIELLRERFDIVKEIGIHKKKNGIAIKDAAREKEVMDKIVEKTKQQGMRDIQEVKEIYNSIISVSRNIQEKD